MSKIRIGIVGCGFMGQGVHIPNFLANEKCEVIALSDTNVEQGKAVAHKFAIPRFYSSPFEMFKDAEVQAVALIVPPQLNPGLAIKAMECGKHVFVEKPMCLNSGDALKMISVAKSKNIRLMVAYMKRYDSGVETAKRLIDSLRKSEELGKITYVRIHNFNGDWICGLSPSIINVKQKAGSENVTFLGVPEFINSDNREDYLGWVVNYSHDLNLMRFLIGNPKRVSFSKMRKGEHAYVTRVTAIFDYDGFDTVLETGLSQSHLWDENVKIYFEKGWVDVKLPAPLLRNVPAKVILYRDKKGTEYPCVSWGWGFQREVGHFIDCLQKDMKFNSDGEDSLKDLILAESIYKALKANKPLEIDYFLLKR